MRKLSIIVVFASLINACSLTGQDNNSVSKINDSINELNEKTDKEKTNSECFKFVSKIRPGASDLSPEKEYADIMKFLEFNDDYDYSFSLFVTEKGDTVTLYLSDRIDNAHKNRMMRVIWQVDTFYEAGEGDAMYFKESMVTFELIKE